VGWRLMCGGELPTIAELWDVVLMLSRCSNGLIVAIQLSICLLLKIAQMQSVFQQLECSKSWTVSAAMVFVSERHYGLERKSSVKIGTKLARHCLLAKSHCCSVL
jgi:hypothetical protein